MTSYSFALTPPISSTAAACWTSPSAISAFKLEAFVLLHALLANGQSVLHVQLSLLLACNGSCCHTDHQHLHLPQLPG